MAGEGGRVNGRNANNAAESATASRIDDIRRNEQAGSSKSTSGKIAEQDNPVINIVPDPQSPTHDERYSRELQYGHETRPRLHNELRSKPYFGSYTPSPVSTPPEEDRVGALPNTKRYTEPLGFHQRPGVKQYNMIEDRPGFFDMVAYGSDNLQRDLRRAQMPRPPKLNTTPKTLGKAPAMSPKPPSRDLRRTESKRERRLRKDSDAARAIDIPLSSTTAEPPAMNTFAAAKQNVKQGEKTSATDEKVSVSKPAPAGHTHETVMQPSSQKPFGESPSIKREDKEEHHSIRDWFREQRDKLTPRWQHRLHKNVVATFICTLFSIIHPVQVVVGQASYLAVTACVFFHPARTLGAQIEATVLGFLGLGLAMGYCAFALWTTSLVNQIQLPMGNLYGRVLQSAFLTVGVGIVSYYRVRFPRLFLFALNASILMVFTLTKVIDATVFSANAMYSFAISLALGAAVNLLVNLAMWPESASQGLGRAFDEALREMRDLLQISSTAFVQECSGRKLMETDPNDAAIKAILSPISPTARSPTFIFGNISTQQVNIHAHLDATRPRTLTSMAPLDDQTRGIPRPFYTSKDIDNTAKAMRGAAAKVNAAYKESRYEISYGYVRPSNWKTTKKLLLSLTKQVGGVALSVKNEIGLLECTSIDTNDEHDGTDHCQRRRSSHSERKNSQAALMESVLSGGDDWETHTFEETKHSESVRKALERLQVLTKEQEKRDKRPMPSFHSGTVSPKNNLSEEQGTSGTPPRSSRTSYLGSRRASAHDDHHLDVRLEPESHQSTAQSIRSFLQQHHLFPGSKVDDTHAVRSTQPSAVSTPNEHISMPEVPQKPPKEIEFGDRELLMRYITGVKDPLLELSAACLEALDCTRVALGRDLDVKVDLEQEALNKEKRQKAATNRKAVREANKTRERALGSKREYGRQQFLTFFGKVGNAFRKYVGAIGAVLHTLFSSSKSKEKLQGPSRRNVLERVATFVYPRRGQPKVSRKTPAECQGMLRRALATFDIQEREHLELMKKDSALSIFDLGHREEIFLVFYFMFSLREVAKELQALTESVAMVELANGFEAPVKVDLEAGEGHQPKPRKARRKRLFWPKIKLSKWINTASHTVVRDRGGLVVGHFEATHQVTQTVSLQHTATQHSQDTTHSEYSNSARPRSLRGRTEEKRLSPRPSSDHASLRSRRSHVGSALSEDLRSEHSIPSEFAEPYEPYIPLSMRIRYNVWFFTHNLRSYNVKFAFKMAVAICVMTMFAYLPPTEYVFSEARGAWAAVSVIIVMNPAVGGTLETGLTRILGTVTGAAWGMLAWTINGADPYILSIMGILFSYVFWFIFLTSTYNKIGSVAIITYTVVTFGAFDGSSPGDTIYSLGWKRMLSIIIGVIVALVLNWIIFPFVARHELRKHVSRTIFDMGLLYSLVLSTYLNVKNIHSIAEGEEEAIRRHEHHLQSDIIKASELLVLTRNEPRLKGPFPVEIWTEVISSNQVLLDRLISLRSAAKYIEKGIRKELLTTLYAQRRDMIAAILLTFNILSASLKSKVPLPPFLPSARVARIRMINRMRELSSLMPLKGQAGLEYSNIYFYAYTACIEEVIEELEHLGNLVGEISGTMEAGQWDVVGYRNPATDHIAGETLGLAENPQTMRL